MEHLSLNAATNRKEYPKCRECRKCRDAEILLCVCTYDDDVVELDKMSRVPRVLIVLRDYGAGEDA